MNMAEEKDGRGIPIKTRSYGEPLKSTSSNRDCGRSWVLYVMDSG